MSARCMFSVKVVDSLFIRIKSFISVVSLFYF
jgi:hypothetical protein